MIKPVELTQEYIKSVLEYNPHTGVFIWIKPGHLRIGETAGTLNYSKGKPYISISIGIRQIQIHRIAFLYMLGNFPKNTVDHINGNGVDNRWENLRDVTQSENNRNMRLPANNKSGCIGVHWCKRAGKWFARIMHGEKRISLGYHLNIEDAIEARRAANIKYGYHENHGSLRPL